MKGKILIALIAILLSGCSAASLPPEDEFREITLPASLFGDEDAGTLIAETEGRDDLTVNDDGTITYRMSKAEYETMREDARENILQTLEEIKSGSNFASIKDVTHNDSFTEFELTVDKAAYENSFDSLVGMTIGFSGAFYQLIEGVPNGETKTTITVKDEATGEVFDTVVFPNEES